MNRVVGHKLLLFVVVVIKNPLRIPEPSFVSPKTSCCWVLAALPFPPWLWTNGDVWKLVVGLIRLEGRNERRSNQDPAFLQESGTRDHTPNSADINTTRKVTHRSVSGRSAPALILVYLSCFFLLFLSLLFHFSLILLAFNLLSLSRSFISCPSCTFPLLCHLLIKLSSMTGESKYDKGESSQVMWLCSQSLLALEEVTQIRYNNWISVRHRKKKRRGQE